MERTESIVIQVAPSYENAKIKEMENFGWNLVGRQEIHEEGEAYGSPSAFSNSYIVKTKVSSYVKLHFNRSLEMPNIDKIKNIESEYFSLPFPPVSGIKGFLWPGIFIIIGLWGTFSGDKDVVPGALIFLVIGLFWGYIKFSKRKKNLKICMESLKRQNELVNEAKALL